jgi:signal transduction histidine kinase
VSRPVPLRLLLLAVLVALIALPASVGTAVWFVEAHRQQADLERRLAEVKTFFRLGASDIDKRSWQQAAKRRLRALHLAAEVTLMSSTGKRPIFTSIGTKVLDVRQGLTKADLEKAKRRPAKVTIPGSGDTVTYTLPAGPGKAQVVAAITYKPLDRTARALWALLSGLVALALAVVAAAWLFGRWLTTPLRELSTHVDRIAGGDVGVEPPRSPVAEIANVGEGLAEMSAQIQRTNERDQQLEQERRFFVTAIAHDLRTPLFTLRGYLEALEHGLPGHERYLPKARAKADQVERLVEQLFALSRAELLHESPRTGTVDLGSVLRGAAHAVDTPVHLFCAGPEGVAVQGDCELLERVAANLIDNALRYAKSCVEVTWGLHDSHAWFAVGDDGPGIAVEALPHVFEPLFRADGSRNTATGGAGLGLTIADKLIRLHGGTISAANGSAGALFTATLPIAER